MRGAKTAPRKRRHIQSLEPDTSVTVSARAISSDADTRTSSPVEAAPSLHLARAALLRSTGRYGVRVARNLSSSNYGSCRWDRTSLVSICRACRESACAGGAYIKIHQYREDYQGAHGGADDHSNPQALTRGIRGIRML